jgi:hypothetical protein
MRIATLSGGLTRWNQLEIIERGPERLALRVTRCLFHERCVVAGVPELTPVICQIDNAAFNSDMPDHPCFRSWRSGPPDRRWRLVLLPHGC